MNIINYYNFDFYKPGDILIYDNIPVIVEDAIKNDKSIRVVAPYEKYPMYVDYKELRFMKMKKFAKTYNLRYVSLMFPFLSKLISIEDFKYIMDYFFCVIFKRYVSGHDIFTIKDDIWEKAQLHYYCTDIFYEALKAIDEMKIIRRINSLIDIYAMEEYFEGTKKEVNIKDKLDRCFLDNCFNPHGDLLWI